MAPSKDCNGFAFAIVRKSNGNILGIYTEEDDAEAVRGGLKHPKRWAIVGAPLNDRLEDPDGPLKYDIYGQREKDYEY